MKNYLGFISIAFLLLTAGAISAQTPASQGNAALQSRTLSVRIDQPFAKVYEFLVNPANWNQWAFGLGKSLRRSGGGWIADSNGGVVKVRFTARNQYGVVDHTVIRPSGAQVYVPMRLITNGSGCELLFTLFREPGITDERYNSDANFVQSDLNRLKEVLEK